MKNSTAGYFLMGVLCLLLFFCHQTKAQEVKVYKDGIQKGLQTTNGKRITEPIYTDIYLVKPYQYAAAKLGEKWGCIDLQGHPITEFKYDRTPHLNRGRSQRTEKLLSLEQHPQVIPNWQKERNKTKWQRVRTGTYCGSHVSLEHTLGSYQETGGFSIVSANSKFGALNAYGKEIIPPEYEQLSSFNYGLSIGRKNLKYGIINTKNETVLPFVYDRVRFVGDSLIVVQKNDQVQLLGLDLALLTEVPIDQAFAATREIVVVSKGEKQGLFNFKTQKWVLDIKYDFIRQNNQLEDPFFASINQKGGMYSHDGEEIIQPLYSYICQTGDHYLVSDGIKYGLLNAEGKTIFPIEYFSINKTICDYYLVQKDRESLSAIANPNGELLTDYSYSSITGCNDKFIAVSKDSLYGLLDHLGNVIHSPDHWERPIVMYEGTNIIRTKKNKAFGGYYLGTRELLKNNFDQIYPSPPGYFVKKNKLQGYILKDGTPFLEVKYQVIYKKGDWFVARTPLVNGKTKETFISLVHGKQAYTIIQNSIDSYQLVGTDNKPIIKSAEHISKYKIDSNKIFFVIKQNGKTGLIDEKGKIVVPINYDKFDRDSKTKRLPNTYFVKQGKNYVILREKKKIVLKGISKIKDVCFLSSASTEQYYLKVEVEEQVGFLDQNGKEVLPCKYDGAHYLSHQKGFLFTVYKDGLVGVVDGKQQELLAPLYQQVIPFTDRETKKLLGFTVTKDGKIGVFNKDGKQMVPFKFDELRHYTHSDKYGPIFTGSIDGFENFYRLDGAIFEL